MCSPFNPGSAEFGKSAFDRIPMLAFDRLYMLDFVRTKACTLIEAKIECWLLIDPSFVPWILIEWGFQLFLEVVAFDRMHSILLYFGRQNFRGSCTLIDGFHGALAFGRLFLQCVGF